ncbi:MAG: hypothetical protein LBT46_04935 [Planctomycetaceae bacterium]|nr:hypothetical protein [Planctomycetaceae bacterium]
MMDADEADEFGLLIEEDETLRFVQWTVFLSEEEMTFLILRLSRCTRRSICKDLRLTKIRYAEILNALKAWAIELFSDNKKRYKKFCNLRAARCIITIEAPNHFSRRTEMIDLNILQDKPAEVQCYILSIFNRR